MMKSVPVDLLRVLLRYNGESGKLYWLARSRDLFLSCKNPARACAIWNTKYAGKEAGTDFQGYVAVGFKSFGHVSIFAHRIVWAMHHGEWPAEFIDHINRDRSDNRISNLRSVSKVENQRNHPRHAHNTSGVSGVNWDKARGQWRAYITIGRKQVSLGRFPSFEEAVSARKRAEAANGFHENHGRKVQ